MTLAISGEVVAQVRAHALGISAEQPGHESLGTLVLDGDRVVRYTKLTNRARRPNRARLASERSLNRSGGLPLILTHSHPWSDPTPSDMDRIWVRHLGLDVFAIYSIPTDHLKLWRLDGDGFAEVALVID